MLMSEDHKPKLSDKELLNYAIENGIIDVDTIERKIEMAEHQKYIEKHSSTIWQSTDGKYYTYLPDMKSKDGRMLIKRNSRESLEDFIVNYYKIDEGEPYTEDVFYEWINSKLRYGEIKKQSYDRYIKDYNRFFKNKRIGEIRIKYVTENMLEDFIKTSIHDYELTAKAWSGLRILINGIFKYAKKKGYTNISITNFMGDIDLSKSMFKRNKKNPKTQVFNNYELQKVVEFIETREPSLLNYGILLMFQTGVRVGELSALQWSDVNGCVLTVNKTEVRYKDENNHYIYPVEEDKTEEGEREIILTEGALRTLKCIKRLNPFGEYIFYRDGRRIRSHSFNEKIKKICEQLNIEKRSTHKARKTYATKLLNANVDESIITKQMGHTDIMTTKEFYYFDNNLQNEAQKKLENAINF